MNLAHGGIRIFRLSRSQDGKQTPFALWKAQCVSDGHASDLFSSTLRFRSFLADFIHNYSNYKGNSVGRRSELMCPVPTRSVNWVYWLIMKRKRIHEGVQVNICQLTCVNCSILVGKSCIFAAETIPLFSLSVVWFRYDSWNGQQRFVSRRKSEKLKHHASEAQARF